MVFKSETRVSKQYLRPVAPSVALVGDKDTPLGRAKMGQENIFFCVVFLKKNNKIISLQHKLSQENPSSKFLLYLLVLICFSPVSIAYTEQFLLRAAGRKSWLCPVVMLLETLKIIEGGFGVA